MFSITVNGWRQEFGREDTMPLLWHPREESDSRAQSSDAVFLHVESSRSTLILSDRTLVPNVRGLSFGKQLTGAIASAG
jgi:hypothetical protein